MYKKLGVVVGVLIIAILAIFPPPALTAAYREFYSELYKETDIPYAKVSDFQKLDIYWPQDFEGPYPVIVSIHGGGYCVGDKVGSDALVAWEGLDRGYAVVSVNYRLSGEDPFPAQINDVKAAVRFIKAHAHEYNLDPNRMAVWGSSAGGTLSAVVGATADVKELSDPSLGNPEQSERVQAVVDWCGPINLSTMDQQYKESGVNGFPTNIPTSYGSKYFGHLVSDVPDLARKANPETYITPDDPPIFIQHGTADDWVPYQQSVEYAAKLEKVLGKDKVFLEIMPGVAHGGIPFNNQENVAKVLDFLDKYLK